MTFVTAPVILLGIRYVHKMEKVPLESERAMSTFIYKPAIIFITATALAVFPLCGAFAECQKLDEYCGAPPTDAFPACCETDTNAKGEEVSLGCKKVDEGVGTCEEVVNDPAEKTD